MMPGPVSDSYDPEFSTEANREDVREVAREVNEEISLAVGKDLKFIVGVVHNEDDSGPYDFMFSEKEVRVIRFCLNRFIEE